MNTTYFGAKWAIYDQREQDHEARKALKKEHEGLKAQIKHLEAELEARKSILRLKSAMDVEMDQGPLGAPVNVPSAPEFIRHKLKVDN